jgi:hypothetical protein
MNRSYSATAVAQPRNGDRPFGESLNPTAGACDGHLFHIIEGKDGKENFWLKIGAGWKHKDGGGISLEYEVFSTKTGRVTLRRMKDEEG